MLKDLDKHASLDLIVRNTNKHFKIRQAKKNRQNDLLTYKKQKRLYSRQDYYENIRKIKQQYRLQRESITTSYNETIKIINDDKILMSLNLTGFYSKKSKKYFHKDQEKLTLPSEIININYPFSFIHKIGLRNFLHFRRLSLKIKKICTKGYIESILLKSKDSYDYELKYKNHIIDLRFWREINEIIADSKSATVNLVDSSQSKLIESKSKIKEASKKIFLIWSNELKLNFKNLMTRKISFKIFMRNTSANNKVYYNTKKEIKYMNPSYSNSKSISHSRYQFKNRIHKRFKTYYSYIEENWNSTPTEVSKTTKLMMLLLSVFPGLVPLINKQYKSSLLTIISFYPISILLVLFSFGFISLSGHGILGILLGQVTLETEYLPIFVAIEAMLSLILLVTLLIIYISLVSRGIITSLSISKGARYSSWKATKRYLQNNGMPYIISTPAYVMSLLIVILPVFTTILLSFTNYGDSHYFNGQEINYNNFENFKIIFGAGELGKLMGVVISWTFVWTLFSSLGPLVIGMLLAIIANSKYIKGKWLFRTIYILPWAIPAFITLLLFANGGNIGGFLTNIFLGKNSTDSLLTKALYAKIFVIAIQIWLGHAYIFLLISGTIQSIPDDIYEAAKIDGAKATRSFLKITLPIILLQTAPLLIGQFAFAFSNFTPIVLVTQGGPFTAEFALFGIGNTDTMLSLVYKYTQSSTNRRLGLAAALSLLVSFIIIVPSSIAFLRSKSFRGIK